MAEQSSPVPLATVGRLLPGQGNGPAPAVIGEFPDSPIFDEIAAATGWTEVSMSPNPSPGPAAGIDVASYQGSPDWAKVYTSGIRFAYIKASEGNSTSYTTVDSQYAGATAAGITVGLYHYARPSLSAASNADALAAQVNRLGAAASGHLPPCLDLEEGTGNLSGWVQTFLARLRERTGCQAVMVYSGSAFFTDHIGESWMDDDTALWIAHYGRPPGRPGYLTERVAIHQHSATGRISGIAGNVDLDQAIWPLSRLVEAPNRQEDEVTTEEHDMIVALYQQMSGTETIGQWPGWETWAGGTGEHLTLVDLARRCNVEVRQAWLAIQQIQAQLAAAPSTTTGGAPGPAAALPDSDVDRIATAVVGLIGHKLDPS